MNYRIYIFTGLSIFLSSCAVMPLLSQNSQPETIQNSTLESFDEKSQARIRIFPFNSNLNKYDNTSCKDWNSRKLKNYFHSLATSFPNTENISINMPQTEKSLSILNAQKKGSGPNIVFKESIVEANQPVVLDARHLEPASGNSCQVAGSFIPKAGQDYEVRYTQNIHSCSIELKKITHTKVQDIYQTEVLNELRSCK